MKLLRKTDNLVLESKKVKTKVYRKVIVLVFLFTLLVSYMPQISYGHAKFDKESEKPYVWNYKWGPQLDYKSIYIESDGPYNISFKSDYLFAPSESDYLKLLNSYDIPEGDISMTFKIIDTVTLKEYWTHTQEWTATTGFFGNQIRKLSNFDFEGNLEMNEYDENYYLEITNNLYSHQDEIEEDGLYEKFSANWNITINGTSCITNHFYKREPFKNLSIDMEKSYYDQYKRKGMHFDWISMFSITDYNFHANVTVNTLERDTEDTNNLGYVIYATTNTWQNDDGDIPFEVDLGTKIGYIGPNEKFTITPDMIISKVGDLDKCNLYFRPAISEDEVLYLFSHSSAGNIFATSDGRFLDEYHTEFSVSSTYAEKPNEYRYTEEEELVIGDSNSVYINNSPTSEGNKQRVYILSCKRKEGKLDNLRLLWLGKDDGYLVLYTEDNFFEGNYDDYIAFAELSTIKKEKSMKEIFGDKYGGDTDYLLALISANPSVLKDTNYTGGYGNGLYYSYNTEDNPENYEFSPNAFKRTEVSGALRIKSDNTLDIDSSINLTSEKEKEDAEAEKNEDNIKKSERTFRQNKPNIIEDLFNGLTHGIGSLIEGLLNLAFGLGTGAEMPSIGGIIFNDYEMTKITYFKDDQGTGVASTIKETVAKIYKAFVGIAAVAYLFILIYTGIRIVLSSTGTEKSKYKEMLKNWFIGLIMLFFFQYVMMYIIDINDAVVEYVEGIGNGDKGYDEISKMMTTYKNEGWTTKYYRIGNASTISSTDAAKKLEDNGYVAGGADDIQFYEGSNMVKTFIWIMLLIKTVVFAILYFKRLLTITVLIIIFPLITITYAIDKMGDGKSQVLDTWLGEFLINVLIQTIHAVCFLVVVLLVNKLQDGAWIFPILAIMSFDKVADQVIVFFGLRSKGGMFKGVAGSALQVAALTGMVKSAAGKIGGNLVGENSKLGQARELNRQLKTDELKREKGLDKVALTSGSKKQGGTGEAGQGTEKNKYDSRLSQAQKEELEEQGIMPDDAEYSGALANYGIKGVDPNAAENSNSASVSSMDTRSVTLSAGEIAALKSPSSADEIDRAEKRRKINRLRAQAILGTAGAAAMLPTSAAIGLGADGRISTAMSTMSLGAELGNAAGGAAGKELGKRASQLEMEKRLLSADDQIADRLGIKDKDLDKDQYKQFIEAEKAGLRATARKGKAAGDKSWASHSPDRYALRNSKGEAIGIEAKEYVTGDKKYKVTLQPRTATYEVSYGAPQNVQTRFAAVNAQAMNATLRKGIQGIGAETQRMSATYQQQLDRLIGNSSVGNIELKGSVKQGTVKLAVDAGGAGKVVTTIKGASNAKEVESIKKDLEKELSQQQQISSKEIEKAVKKVLNESSNQNLTVTDPKKSGKSIKKK